MNIGVVGSRKFNNYNILKRELDKIVNKEDFIVSGGAKGADTLASEYSLKVLNKNPIVFMPEYNRWGRRATFIRNTSIVENSNKIVAFWDEFTKGTKDTIDKAKKFNIEVIILNYHYLILNELSDINKIKYLIEETPYNYTLWLDNDETFITVGKNNNPILLKDCIGKNTLLLDYLNLNYEFV